MLDFTVILPHSLGYGLIYGFLLAGLILGSLWYNAEMWHQDYPEAIKAKVGPISEKAKRQRAWFALLFFPLTFGFPLLVVWRLSLIVGDVGFAAAFLMVFILFFLFNLIDLLVVDWLIAVYLRPSFLILPGIEGMAEYHDYGYHFRAFLIGLIFCLVSGVVIGGIGSLIW
ncbi:MAG: hypothetical protein KJ063_13210 [Anaerolineae bacterium]|nr:hypothetical protein [Anaerolineae bacterium]